MDVRKSNQLKTIVEHYQKFTNLIIKEVIEMSEAYPEGFKVIGINRNETCRYSLEIKTPNENADKALFVLMKNPSVGDEKLMDPTIKLLVKHVAPRYRKMIIVNASPVIETDSENLNDHREEIEKQADKNARVITEMAQNLGEADLLLATGEVEDILKGSYVELMNQISQSELGNHLYMISSVANYGGHPLGKLIADMEKLTPVEQADAEWHLKEIKA
ncbi:DUF1643 domain-containing protein [Levilactobacillus lettrarii]|uniref:DUF1643 domain-containing protein n=2 Tax=Lactobacillaceae TaxID=33958 RepID=UPI003756787B